MAKIAAKRASKLVPACKRSTLQAHGPRTPLARRPLWFRPKEESNRLIKAHIRAFVHDKCRRGKRLTESAGALWYAYLGWCRRHAIVPMSQNRLGRALTSYGFARGRCNGGTLRIWRGLRLLPSNDAMTYQ